jgi:hypothetical protein
MGSHAVTSSRHVAAYCGSERSLGPSVVVEVFTKTSLDGSSLAHEDEM